MLRLTAAEEAITPMCPGPLRAVVASLACLLRSVPLFFGAAPATPLRVLCIVALDTIHVLRYAQPLTRQRRDELAAFLDFQACTNAVWDGKPLCAAEHQALRRRLEQAGMQLWIEEYLRRLRELETSRPSVDGNRSLFHEVRSYREAVVRLSLGTIAAIALNARCLDEGIQATHCDSDVEALFRMAMQCQVIDDVLDYGEDLAGGLPSFQTSASLPEALASTAEAARSYAARGECSADAGALPLRVALHGITAVTRLVVAVARSRESIERPRAAR